MNTSQTGIDSIKKSEGSVSTMYRDSVGLPTIGVGHLLLKSELSSGKLTIAGVPVAWAKGLTSAQIEDLLRQDLHGTEEQVAKVVRVSLQQHQFDALVSFTFNVGGAAFANSQLAKRINAGQFEDVPGQLRRWIYAGGVVQEGLKKRREEEIRLWNGA